MPVHNEGHYLAIAVESILKQTHALLELIIIDDNSTDGATEALSKRYDDKRIKLLYSPGRGIIDALNYGAAHAAYPVLARMDGDDIAHAQRIEQQLRYLNDHPKVDIVGAQVRLFRDSSHVGEGYVLYQRWINSLCEHKKIAEQFFVESAIAHPTAMLRKTAFEQLGGYQDHGWPEDYDLWCRAFLAGYKFGKPSGNPLLHWRDHSQRASRQDQRYTKQSFLRCKAHYLARFLREQFQATHCIIWGTGPTGLKMHDYLEQNGVEVASFIDINPKLIGRTKRGKEITVFANGATLPAPMPGQPICLVAVSARGARDELRKLFKISAWREGKHFLFVA